MTDFEKHLAARRYLRLSIDLKIMAIILVLIAYILLLGNYVLPAVLMMASGVLVLVLGYLYFSKYKDLTENKT